uniref:Uncharacterized protein n=1 Tax=Tanacetum cinerariifolium TaxID=118510 RepID=A0A6L2NDE7_TANCI|nr:hypothetical protein [Tanacetum cinerariifolium]
MTTEASPKMVQEMRSSPVNIYFDMIKGVLESIMGSWSHGIGTKLTIVYKHITQCESLRTTGNPASESQKKETLAIEMNENLSPHPDLKERLKTTYEAAGGRKVNIISHSMGGFFDFNLEQADIQVWDSDIIISFTIGQLANAKHNYLKKKELGMLLTTYIFHCNKAIEELEEAVSKTMRLRRKLNGELIWHPNISSKIVLVNVKPRAPHQSAG